jgi:tight adherence protein C
MVLIVILSVALLATAVSLALRARALPSANTADRLMQIEAYGFHAADAAAVGARASEPGSQRLARTLGRGLLERSKRLSEPEIRSALMSAGMYNTQPSTFIGYRVGSAMLVGGGFLLLSVAGGAAGALVVFGTALATVVGFGLPMTIVKRRTRIRHEEIDYTLPELIDVLVVTVEAGLGFSGSLQMAADRIHGPLGEELLLTIQQESMGMSSDEALAGLLRRVDTPAMRSFVRSVLQAESLGISLGEIMRTLAIEMRLRRRQAAEERAQKAPVKILFPLVFLIFPPIFVIVLYPALKALFEGLGGA